ncbi:MAG: DUF4202 domain-containing protein [Acidimicrobiia bacterium]|nr:DUF4202 domain-containing protein [Acidimicrobiia bacterium]
MRGRLSGTYASAVASIDAANAEDPNLVRVRGHEQPLALAHGRLAAEWIERLVDDPSEALLLAARAHHLRRWEVPRSSYPDGRAGYLRWRRDQKDRHASEVVAILAAAGYGEAAINRVQVLVRRARLDSANGTQTVEDAACLVFLETQLSDLAARLDRDHLIEVLRRTAAKMSDEGRALVGEIPLDAEATVLLAAALG